MSVVVARPPAAPRWLAGLLTVLIGATSARGQSMPDSDAPRDGMDLSSAIAGGSSLGAMRGVLADMPGLDVVPPGGWLPPESPRPEGAWDLTLESYGQYSDLGDLENSAGDVSVWRAGVDLRLDAPAIGDIDWSLRAGYEYSSYDFTTGSSPLVGSTSNLVDDVTAFDLSWDLTYRIDDEWSLFGGVGALIAGESGADFSDRLNFGGRLGAAYQVDDDLSIGFGAYVREDFGEGVEVLPLLLVDWRIDDEWSFSLDGSQLELAWTPNDSLRLAFYTAFEIRAYALADDGISPNGAFNDERWVVGLGADWRLMPNVDLRAMAGAVVSQEFDIEDRDGEDFRSVESDSTGLTASLGLSIRF